jgi:predicted MPP superfamily phosphohydrolase
VQAPPATAPESAGPGWSRRQFIGAAAVFTPPLLTFGAAAVGEGQLDDFRIRRMEVNLADLPPALDGFTIAHVTDTHVGRFTHGRVLERIVEATNGLNADMVAMTGDLINDSLRAMPAALDMVRGFRARKLVVTCEGNHDLIDNPFEFYRQAAQGGLPLLRGDTTTIEVNGQRMQILGLPWSRHISDTIRDTRALLAKRDPNAWPLILAHHPHAWDQLPDIPLTLAGHTHGGQLMLNEHQGAGSLMFRYWTGMYRRNNDALVVSNGTGNWFPVRIHAPAEILHLTLRRRAV